MRVSLFTRLGRLVPQDALFDKIQPRRALAPGMTLGGSPSASIDLFPRAPLGENAELPRSVAAAGRRRGEGA